MKTIINKLFGDPTIESEKIYRKETMYILTRKSGVLFAKPNRTLPFDWLSQSKAHFSEMLFRL